MKFAVLALIAMYAIVQAGGKIVLKKYPSSSMGVYYNSIVSGRKQMLHPEAAAVSNSYSSQYYHAKNKQAHKQKNTYMQTITTADGRRMIIPLPIPLIYPRSYNSAAHSASASSAANQQSYNYQQRYTVPSAANSHIYNYQGSYMNRRIQPPAEEVEADATPATCEREDNASGEGSPEAGDEVSNNGDKYRDTGDKYRDNAEKYRDNADKYRDNADKYRDNGDKYRDEMCLYIKSKMEQLLGKMTPTETYDFFKSFVVLVDEYCDFARLEN